MLIQLAAGSGLEEPGFFTASVDIETPRGRALGKADALFVDVPWGMAPHFLAFSSPSQPIPSRLSGRAFCDRRNQRPAIQGRCFRCGRWVDCRKHGGSFGPGVSYWPRGGSRRRREERSHRRWSRSFGGSIACKGLPS